MPSYEDLDALLYSDEASEEDMEVLAAASQKAERYSRRCFVDI